MPLETGPTTKAMLDAIYAVYPRLCRDLHLDSARARKMLRIEADYEIQTALRYESEPGVTNAVAWAGVCGARDGVADSLHGVSIYWLYKVPAPGWRLINPLDHDTPLHIQKPPELEPAPPPPPPPDGPMSLKQAAVAGIERVRLAAWVDPLDHVKLDIIHGHLGPWLHFYSPGNQSLNRRDPVDLLAVRPDGDPNAAVWVPYTGPVADSDEYRAAVAAYGEMPL